LPEEPGGKPAGERQPGCKELRLAQAAAAGFEAEPGEGVEDDFGEVVVVADDEGEEADIEGFPDEADDDVLVRRDRPEQAGQGDVDRDQHAGEPLDIALQQPEPGIDVLGEGAEETVDDAGAVHCGWPGLALAAGASGDGA
jgi:hypothetical protein